MVMVFLKLTMAGKAEVASFNEIIDGSLLVAAIRNSKAIANRNNLITNRNHTIPKEHFASVVDIYNYSVNKLHLPIGEHLSVLISQIILAKRSGKFEVQLTETELVTLNVFIKSVFTVEKNLFYLDHLLCSTQLCNVNIKDRIPAVIRRMFKTSFKSNENFERLKKIIDRANTTFASTDAIVSADWIWQSTKSVILDLKYLKLTAVSAKSSLANLFPGMIGCDLSLLLDRKKQKELNIKFGPDQVSQVKASNAVNVFIKHVAFNLISSIRFFGLAVNDDSPFWQFSLVSYEFINAQVGQSNFPNCSFELDKIFNKSVAVTDLEIIVSLIITI